MPQSLRKPFLIGWAAFLLSQPFHVVRASEDAKQTGERSQSPAAPGTEHPSPPLKTSEYRSGDFKELPREVLRDQKFLWLRPFRMKRSDLPWVGMFVGTTAGLIAIDERVGQALSGSPPGTGYSFSHGVGKLGTPLTGAGIAATIYLLGRRDHNEHAQATGILGLRAIADSVLVVEVLKNVTQRPRPTFSGGRVRNHNADGEFFAGGRSFPSGHAAGAWALATVVAERNPDRRWIPPTAYGLASLVSISRITQRRHFPSDVFAGAAFGYLIGRHVAHSSGPASNKKRHRLQLVPYVAPGAGPALALNWEF